MVLATGSWPVLVPVNLILSVLLAVLTAILYWQTLGSYGRLRSGGK